MKGLFYYCNYEDSKSLNGFSEIFLITKWDCLNYGGEWNQYDQIYDNIQKSLIGIFVISQTFNWA